jgi:enoyl-CoA hydratase/carnithine racemase
MAQLERAPDGMKMNELSRRMMVTGGNITGITDQLVGEALVERVPVAGDRRAYRVRLTAKGRALFAEMAHAHEEWVVQAFAGLQRPRGRHAPPPAGQGQAAYPDTDFRGHPVMKHYIGPANPMHARFEATAAYQARHFSWSCEGGVGTITLSRPERKNPLTFESYAELGQLFEALGRSVDVKAVVVTGAGGNFCSGGDVHEIIGPLTRMTMPELLEFTRMTGNLVRTMRNCPQPVIGAIDGICAGAGAMMALACDMRYGTAASRTAFLFTRVGLAGADMGACALLPRVIGQGRASELLFTGRAMTAQEGLAWGFFNALHDSADLLPRAQALAAELAAGPTFAHGMTKTMLQQEWAMTIEQAVEAEAQAQAICMQTQDFTARLRGVRGASRSRSSAGTERCRPRPTIWRCRSSTQRTANWGPAWPPGRRSSRWMKPTTGRPAGNGCAAWVTPAGCAIACRPRMAARWSGWTPARW